MDCKNCANYKPIKEEECKFKIGDRVKTVNEYYGPFGNKTLIGTVIFTRSRNPNKSYLISMQLDNNKEMINIDENWLELYNEKILTLRLLDGHIQEFKEEELIPYETIIISCIGERIFDEFKNKSTWVNTSDYNFWIGHDSKNQLIIVFTRK